MSKAEFKTIAVDFDPFADGKVLFTAPATAAQKEIWASVQMGDDANLAYNESQSLKLRGELDLAAFKQAIQQLVTRHEALRTTFSTDGKTLCITERLEIEIPYHNLSSLDSETRAEQISKIQQQAVKLPFDLEHGPLFRAQILQLDRQEYITILTTHHIICDGWSWWVLISDLGKIYSALKQNSTPILEPVDFFSEYAILEEAQANSPEKIATENFWIEKFSDSIPVLDLPTDHPRPPLRTFNSAQENFPLAADLVDNLKRLSSNSGCSLMTTLIAGFEVFLHRLTGQTDLVLGVPAAGQAASGRYNLVGHCVNLLPLRTKIEAQQSFSDYLRSRRTPILDAYDHQKFTFGNLVQKLSIPRDSSRIPLVSAVFNVDQDFEPEKFNFGGLKIDFFTNPRCFENFELSINATSVNGRVNLECQYNTNLFDRDTIRCRLAEFDRLLTSIVTNPEETIATLPLLPEAERQLLHQWNQTAADYPDVCIHQLFEKQVERTPDAVALIDRERQLTYRELNERANQLAHYLQDLGVAPEVLVGFCVNRSLEMIVGLLAILKAGGAYVPLDPAYPAERLAYMVEDAKVSILLSQSQVQSRLPEHQAQTVYLDSDWDKISLQSRENLPKINTGNNLAYVIYTSGSTGKPKGVMIPHLALSSFVRAAVAEYEIVASDRILQFSSINFDAAVEEIYTSLISGSTLVLRTDEMLEVGTFLHSCKDWQLTILDLPTAYWYELVNELTNTAAELPQSVRMIIIGGEKVLSEPVKSWNKYLACSGKSDHLQLINSYGPTETTVSATVYRIPSSSSIEGEVPIGRPLPHLQTYVLDRFRQLVPIGVPGELYIGGAGLARGYLDRQELTAEKFISNPVNQSQSQLYKTGDLVRFLADGNIEFLGRIDHQVKIRGFRIEPGEIEANLLKHSQIETAVVALREDNSGDKSLVAYFVPTTESKSDPQIGSQLRQFLKEKLPAYMVPGFFVELETLPLTPSGKIDRRALPEPDFDSRQSTIDYIAPRNALEEQVTQIWLEVLGHKQIGIHDNFFELGGHSLIGVKLVARLSQLLEIKLPLRVLFEASTIAELAQRIETIRSANQVFQHNNHADDLNGYEEGEI